jgi:hypothetical protein
MESAPSNGRREHPLARRVIGMLLTAAGISSLLRAARTPDEFGTVGGFLVLGGFLLILGLPLLASSLAGRLGRTMHRVAALAHLTLGSALLIGGVLVFYDGEAVIAAPLFLSIGSGLLFGGVSLLRGVRLASSTGSGS